MKIQSILGRLFSLLILIPLAFGCNGQNRSSLLSKTAYINLVNEPSSIDPRRARDLSSQILMKVFFEGLTRVGPGDKTQMALAKSVEVSDDLKTYIFFLREAKWSNGKPIRAADFVYTWKKHLSPGFSSDNAYQLFILKNGKEVKTGVVSEDELGVRAIGDNTLVVELNYATPYFLELVASPVFFPISQEVEQENPHWLDKVDSYVTSGPFLLKSWKHHNAIQADKNPRYWDEKEVKLDGLFFTMVENEAELKMFEKGELHWAGSPISTIPVDAIAHYRSQLYTQPMDETAFLRVNVEKDWLSHPKIRKALSLSIDRSELVEHVLQGGQLPAQRLVPPSMQLQEEAYFPDGDIEQARELFQQGLMELGLSNNELSRCQLTYINRERTHLIAQAMQQQWYKALGINIGLEALERKVFFDRLSHQDYSLAISSWGADFHDPVNFLEVFKYRSQSTNNTNWESEQYIAGLDASFLTNDAKVRGQLLGQCEKILMDAMPIIPLFHYKMLYLRDERLKGVFLSSMGGVDFKWASLENAPK